MTSESERSGKLASDAEEASGSSDVGGPLLLGLLILILGLFAGWGWAVFVLALLVMIFMHELGHYLTARLTGMKVTEFFLGFGPRLWSIRRGDTEYGLKAVPAGAYVRIVGMNNLDEITPGDEGVTYRSKSYPRRMLVVSAGSLMHFLMAIGLFALSGLVYGVVDDPDAWSVRAVSSMSAAEELGIEPGDQIVSVAGVSTRAFPRFGETVKELAGEAVAVTWERDGETYSDVVTIGMRLNELGAAGFDGLLPGDRILAIDGLRMDTFSDVETFVSGQGQQPFTVTIDPVGGGPTRDIADVTATRLPGSDSFDGFFGIGRQAQLTRLGPLASLRWGGEQFVDVLRLSGEGLVRFFSPSSLGSFVSDSLRGGENTTASSDAQQRQAASLDQGSDNLDEGRIMSIYGAARLGANASFDGQILLLAALNVFIGVFNLLPLPPLDGGHVAIGTYERLRSRRGVRYEVDYNRILPLTYAVFVFLMMLGVLALVRDVLDPITLG